MKIAIVGLGLIGGSLAKTIKKRTGHLCYGLDHDASTLKKAQKVGAINQAVEPEVLGEMDFTIIALHPRQTIDFLLENAGAFRPGSVVMDVCGVKKAVVDAVTAPLAEKGVLFVGTHPMAGREFSGFDYAQEDLFQRASFIITPVAGTSSAAVETVKELATELGFPKAVSYTHLGDTGRSTGSLHSTGQYFFAVLIAYSLHCTGLENGFPGKMAVSGVLRGERCLHWRDFTEHAD